MNILQLRLLENQDFGIFRNLKSGLMFYLLNTLRKGDGGGGTSRP
jgi:hypothetical protein